MKNEFRDEFDKLLLLDNDKEKIKNNIYRISKINKRKRKMYSLFLSLIFVSFMTFCIAYADDIKDTLNNIFYYHVTKGDYQKKDYMLLIIVVGFSLFSLMEAHLISIYILRNYLFILLGYYWYQPLVRKEI